MVEYYHGIRHSSPESYALFYNDYADTLFREYFIWLPPYKVDFSDFVTLLRNRPALRSHLNGENPGPDEFPTEYRQFLDDLLGQADSLLLINSLLETVNQQEQGQNLPYPREIDLTCIYEDGNPYKEIGLKTHFERLGHFNFITRLQSYRYLSKSKASQDRIQYISPDCLAGIFTNKEKSIYYYIYLTEADQLKAKNAARLLNLALYGKGGEL